MDLITEKALRVANYTKSSADGRYSGKKFDSGYHTITVKGETFEGQRNNQKRLSQLSFDFKDKVVLDIGCNMGGMLHELSGDLRYGAGVDFDSKCINAANFIATVNKADNIKFFTFDLEKESIHRLWNFIPYEKIDVCFFLALSCWVNNWKEIIDFCAQISDNLLFETNAYPKELKQENIDYLNIMYEKVKVLSTKSEDDPITQGRVLLWCSNTQFELDDSLDALSLAVSEPIEIRGIEPFENMGCQRRPFIIRGKNKDYFLGIGGQRNWADYAVSKYLRSKNVSVVDTVVASEDRNGKAYIIREYIRSTTLDQSKYKTKIIKSSVKATLKEIKTRVLANKRRENIVQKVLKEICTIHNIETDGYGFVAESSSDGAISGISKTWIEFLQYLVSNEGEFLRVKNIISQQDFYELNRKYQIYFQNYSRLFDSQGYFLTGDIGWSNILISEDEKVYFTDLEFALFGDPAFEFSCMRDYTKKHLAYYMSLRQKKDASFDKNAFEKRIKLYEPLKMLFVSSYAAARNGRNKIAKSQFDWGITLLEKTLAKRK